MPGMDIEQLNIKIVSESQSAADGLTNLIDTLEKLNNVNLSKFYQNFKHVVDLPSQFDDEADEMARGLAHKFRLAGDAFKSFSRDMASAIKSVQGGGYDYDAIDRATETLQKNGTVIEKSEDSWKRLREYVSKSAGAISAASVAASEFPDAAQKMAAVLGKGWSFSSGNAGKDISEFVMEMDSVLGTSFWQKSGEDSTTALRLIVEELENGRQHVRSFADDADYMAYSFGSASEVVKNAVGDMWQKLQENPSLEAGKQTTFNPFNEALSAMMAAAKTFRPESISKITTALNDLGKAVNSADFSAGVEKIAPFVSAINQMQFNETSVRAISSLGTSFKNLAAARIPVGLFDGFKTLVEQMNGVQINPQMLAMVQQLAAAIASLSSRTEKRYNADFTALASGLERLFQVLARAPSINPETIQTLQALGKLNTDNVKAAGAMMRMSDSAERGARGTAEYAESARRGAISTHSLTTRLAFAIGKFRQIYFLVRRLVSVFGNMVESAMDYVETLNYFSAAFDQVASRSIDAFGDAGQEAGSAFTNRFAQEAEKLTEKMSGYAVDASGMVRNTGMTTLGLNPERMMNYQATFAQMASSMGVSSDVATDLSRALTEIGADLASVKNMGFEQTWENLQSGLVGMSRAVDKYGLNIRNVNLQQKLTELGIEANIQAMNQQDKALLRTIIILENSQYAWGDLSDTLQQPANQLRMLQSGIQNLGRTIGNLFMPIVAAALPYVNAFVVALQRMLEVLIDLIGIDFDWASVGGAAGVNSEWADYLDDTADGFTNATAAAKEWQNQLLGFDEINKLGSESSDDSSSSAGNPLITGQLEGALRAALDRYQRVWDESYNNVSNKVNEIAERIIGWFGRLKTAAQPTLNAMSRLWNDVLKPLGLWKWEALKGFYENFLKPLGEWVLGEGIPRLVDALVTLYEHIDWAALKDALDKFWKAIEPLAEAYFEGIIAFVNAITPLATLTFDAATNFIANISELLNGLDPTILKLLGEVLGAAAGIKFFGGLFGLGNILPTLLGLGGKGALATGGKGLLSKLFGFGGKALLTVLAGDALNEIIQDQLTDGGKTVNHGGKRWAEWASALGTSGAEGALIGSKFGTVGTIIGTMAGLIKALGTFEDSAGEGFDDKLRTGSEFVLEAEKRLLPLAFALIQGKTLDELEADRRAREEKYQKDQEQRDRARAYRTYFNRKQLVKSGWSWLTSDEHAAIGEYGDSRESKLSTIDAQADSMRDKRMAQYRQRVVHGWHDIVDGAKQALENRAPNLFAAMDHHKQTVDSKMAASGNSAKQAYASGFNGLGGEIDKALNGVANVIAKNKMAHDSEARKAGASAKDAFKSGLSPIGSEVSSIMNGLNNKIGSALSYVNVKSSLGGVITAFKNTFGEAANAAINQYNSMAENLSTATINKNRALNFSKVPSLAYANGGFPEDGFFFANSTEMVGRFANGRTAVANNEQIIAGIEGGVARGMAQALMSSASVTGGQNGQPVQVVINVDSETLYRTTLRGQNKYNSRYHLQLG